MKEKIKFLVLGIIIGVLLVTSGVFAINGTMAKELLYNNIKITLDDNEIEPRDAKGNYVEPFIIDGTTYLPVRAIASALGIKVNWDFNNNTVQLFTNDYEPIVESKKHFVIATDMNFAPFEFKDADENIVGIDVDILAAIAEDQGFTYDLEYIGWDAAISACIAEQADGMIAGITVTNVRKNNGWIFSDGYFDITQGMAVASDSEIKGFEDLSGKKVAVKNGTMCNQYAESIKDQYGFEVVTFSTSPDMYYAVISGQADACFDYTPILKHNIKTYDLDLKFVEGTENHAEQYAFAIFDSEKQELIDLFNRGLKNIKENGKYDEIISKYLD